MYFVVILLILMYRAYVFGIERMIELDLETETDIDYSLNPVVCQYEK